MTSDYEKCRKLWQSVIIVAVNDANAQPLKKNHHHTISTERYAQRDADTWLSRRGKDMCTVCALAGVDPDFLSDAYNAGRLKDFRLSAHSQQRKKVAAK